ncbi:WXG100 family type VII secretion target [Streptomyces cinerochromogenes]|uniref:WXG100 family type VII secretion target n=1 Tax=Streptomyces cinerochromogenes TaxID=66422 RepID=UPI001670F534|nr:WXG100 family type VII secretion target [Streptomyces cinerochromogenes]GGS99452.1 hypothetical protein GCM10010206_72650 [Streptomyces cinerochromogenes]
MPDYNQGGFHDDGTGIYADPTVQGSPSDYDSWDWKQIMAAITGGSALVPGEGGDARASSVASPQTLVAAANDFQFVQQVMAMVATSLADQAKALAGGDGAPWQGGAADAFLDTMTTFSKQVVSNAEALGGGATGSSVAQNLVWSANALTVAQANIHAIDSWYANQAARLGVKPMANGLMPISQKPELVQMMTDDMRAELKKLATNYAQVNQVLGRVQPKPVVSPVKDPGSTGGGKGGPDLSTGGGGGTGGGPDLSTLGGDGGGGSGGPDLSTLGGGGGGSGAPDLSTLGGGGGEGGTGSPSPFPGGTSLPDLATTGGGGTGDLGTTGDPGTTGSISPFPGVTSTGGLGSGGAGSPDLTFPDTGTGNAGGTGGTVDPFTGGTTAPGLPTGTGGTGTVDPFPGSTGTGLNLDPSTGTGTGTVPGSAVPLPGFGSVGRPTTGNTGSSTSGQGLNTPVSAWTGGADAPQLGAGGTGASLPETGTIGTPDLGSAGGTGAAALPSDLLSSAPGVGTPAAMPSSSLASAPGLPDASALGSAGGAGMPMMPMSPGTGAGTQNGTGAERPDASGLLGGEVKPWSGGAELGGLPEAEPVAGAAAGGAGLSGLGAGSSLPVTGVAEAAQPAASSVPGAGEGAGVAAGMPMMPMAPGMGAPGAGAQGGAGAERPDASGLLGGEVKPWSGGAELGGLPEAEPVAGAAAGGAGLSGLGAGSSLPVTGLAEAAQSAASSVPGAGEGAGVAAGMPMMPMAPGMGAPGAGGQGGAGAERPDASGLLGGEVKPWSGGAELGGLPEAEPVAGAAAGGAGLSGLGAGSSLPVTGVAEAAQPEASSVPGAGEGAGVAAGMPFMPMAPGTGAAGAGAANTSGGERPDTSGLLDAGTTPWTGAGEAGAETGPVAGAPAGGSGLSGTAGTASAMPVPVLPLPVMPAARRGTEDARSGSGQDEGGPTTSSALLGGSSAVWSPDGEAETEAPSAPAAPAQESPDTPAQGFPAVVPTGATAPSVAQAAVTAQRAAAAGTGPEGAEAVPGEPAIAVPLPDLPDDRVPVPARSEAADDTSAWDVAAAGFGMLMLAFAGQGSGAVDEHGQSTTGYATAAPAVWEAEGTGTVRAAERTVDPGTAPFAEPELTTWRPAARAGTTAQGAAAVHLDPDEIRCGNGAGEPPEEPEAGETGRTAADGEQEDDDAEDKGMVDLLTQDASTWGARPVVPDSLG